MNLLSVLMFLYSTATSEPSITAITIQDNVTFWIAVVGGAIGLAGFVLSTIIFSQTRQSLFFETQTIGVIEGNDSFCCEAILSNSSSLPISITGISLKCNGISNIEATDISVMYPIKENDKDYHLSIKSSLNIITLSPYESQKVILSFKPFHRAQADQIFPNKSDTETKINKWKFILKTSRRTITKK